MSRVVIFMGDGGLQGIFADSFFTDVLILDRNIEGVDQDDPGLRKVDGETFYVGRGVDLVDPEYVEEIFKTAVEA